MQTNIYVLSASNRFKAIEAFFRSLVNKTFKRINIYNYQISYSTLGNYYTVIFTKIFHDTGRVVTQKPMYFHTAEEIKKWLDSMSVDKGYSRPDLFPYILDALVDFETFLSETESKDRLSETESNMRNASEASLMGYHGWTTRFIEINTRGSLDVWGPSILTSNGSLSPNKEYPICGSPNKE